MQIVPVPGASWSNAAAAQQANNESPAGPHRAASAEGVRPAVGDVERSSETFDRDADGRTDGGPGQRGSQDPSSKRGNEATDPNPGTSFLDLPALGQSSELDLLG